MTTLYIRKLSGLAFVGVYILLGIPLWYKLTTIYRAPLPRDYIESLHESKYGDVHLTIPVFIRSDIYKFPDIHDATQIQINHLLDSKKQNIPWSLQILPYNETFVEESKKEGREYHIVTLVLDEFVGYNSAYDAKETLLYFDDSVVVHNDLPFFVAQTLVEHSFNIEWNYFSDEELMSSKNNSIALNYSPNIHLSISLLKGDGLPVDWEIDETLKQHFTPFRKFLSPLVNFTIDSSIVNFNDLDLHKLNNTNTTTWNDISHMIDLSELSSMNYFSESSVINLAIVFPNNETNSGGFEFIEENEHGWQSFIVPQWGILVINKMPLEANTVLTKDYLNPIMYKFANDIFELLGVTTNFEELFSPIITIDSFKRVRILQNLDKAVETLWSLVKLTEQFQQMAIPKKVMANVKKVLDTRLDVVEILNNPSKGDDLCWNKALSLSNEMIEYSEEAFFHGEMLKQNFFPQEHKLAVYLPLMGPISIVLFSGVVALLKEKDEEEVDKKPTTKEEMKDTEKVGAIEGVDELPE